MALEVKSGAGVSLLTVDPTSLAARATLYDETGAQIAVGQNESITDSRKGFPVAGVDLRRNAHLLRVDRLGTVKAGDPAIRFIDPFDVNMTTTTGALWVQTSTTQAAAVASNVKTYNSASTLTAATGVQDVSLQKFERRVSKPIRWRQRAMIKWGTVVGPGTNGVIDMGFGAPAAVATLAVTDGVFFRATASGGLTIVYALGGAETTLETLGTFSAGVITSDGSVVGFVNGKSIRVDSYYWWEIVLVDDLVIVRIDDPESGDSIFDESYTVARTLQGLVLAPWVSCFNRVFNSGAVTTACQLLANQVIVEQLDASLGMTFDDMLAGMQRGSNVVPTTQVQAANHANTAAPASAVLSNSAAGYTTLGGQWQFAAVAGAETDYALFGFTVPVGYRFRCKRIKIDTINTGVAVATTAHVFQWAVSHNAATINLSTGTQFREEIGMQSLPIAAAVGAIAAPVEWVGNKVTESGRLFIVIVKMPIATATATQIIRGICTVEGQFE